MVINISKDAVGLGREAAKEASVAIQNAIEENGYANIILATGTSQFETLNQLVLGKGIDWSKVVMFHLDEYIELPITHEASFRKYLKERFLNKVPALKAVYLINGELNSASECERLGELIKQHPIDVALVGIGENAHLAFNDPPADFETQQPYHVVQLDELCRKQQLAEGWFTSLDEVPAKAISMSIQQIMKSKNIICSVPETRKAFAIKNCLENAPDSMYPASILQIHPQCKFYFDQSSAALLSEGTVEKAINNEFSLADK